jgi:hypothetical protein
MPSSASLQAGEVPIKNFDPKVRTLQLWSRALAGLESAKPPVGTSEIVSTLRIIA